MNSLQRVLAAVGFAPVDRTPVIAQVFGHAATLCGVPLGEYVRDGELLARCQLQALARYGYDAVFALMDVNVEAEAAGATLRTLRHGYPSIERHPCTPQTDFKALEPPDPAVHGRMPQLVRAVSQLRGELGDEVPVIGCVLGPVTLVMQLLGVEQAMYLAMDDLPRFEQALDFAVETQLRFGLAQIEAGAHLPLVFDPSSSPEVIPAAFFRELALPRLARLFAAFKDAGAAASWLHIAGRVESILPYYPQAGVDIANFDYCVSAEAAMGLLPEICLDGNVTPCAFVESSPQEVGAAARALDAAFAPRGGFILSSGCEIPPESRPENIEALVAAARREA